MTSPTAPSASATPAARTVATTPFTDQRPGTSGLRKRVPVFQQPHYLENFVQAVLDVAALPAGATLVVGGDGRYLNREAVQTILRMAAAAGAGRVIVGARASCRRRRRRASSARGRAGGFILSASHNPGGPDGDFGVKYNLANGGPAPEAFTDAVATRTRTLAEYRTLDAPDAPLDTLGTHAVGAMEVEVVDPVADYAALMERLFDFAAIRRLIAGADGRAPFRLRFDAMHAVTGPYAAEILERRLGAPGGTVVNGTPLPDFGGGHPDPNLTYAPDLVAELWGEAAPDFGAASDGDGDRNMILGRRFFVTPSDSLAVLAANATVAPGYARGLAGVARSMPTSAAADRVARRWASRATRRRPGWKFFGSLPRRRAHHALRRGELRHGQRPRAREGRAVGGALLAQRARRRGPASRSRTWCGRTGGASAGTTTRGTTTRRCRRPRRRRDGAPARAAPHAPGHRGGGRRVGTVDDFTYQDPVDGSVSTGQGLRVLFDDGARIVYRLSGTGTEGATLRLYIEAYEPDPARQAQDAQDALAPLIAAALALGRLREHTGRAAPTVVT
jgi:phosphoglucomutase